ncbi:FAD-binding oxidoreductase [Salinisphaera sp. Q1T1-3]|uniref:NAD(P)/FAD-dependent oxidoreductase n=1 Tax=Salinisphaera sp. Q1T1-3 TaxID=2321229 RepID=UPI000E741623|nr:FAD-binding oxidoreductase [Salinisphaera sp. Q1T1-3]RJS91966.1 FAD-binding oxidoreductase [Salinisphaera sp. Q1T1-3]
MKQSSLPRAWPHAPSYYAASAHPAPARPPAEGHRRHQICVVGAGFSGLSTALALAERGYDVCVVEASHVGWGASGRNGGQLVNGYSRDLDVVAARYGRTAAAALGAMAFEGADIIRDRVHRYGIDCHLRDGGVFAALNRRQLDALVERVTSWQAHGHDALEILDEHTIRAHAATDRYVGGLLDRRGGHVHPLNLALGEAAAIEALGGTIHEQSPVVSIEHGPVASVHTERATIRADTLVLCGNAYLGNAVPALRDRVMPVATQVMATEPLGAETAARLMPAGTCVEDCNYMLDYYRMSADHRLLFGGGTVYGGTTPADIQARLRPHLARTFGELANVRIDYAWSGNFALTLTRIPHLGRLADNVYFTHGYSGHGVTTTHLAGVIVAEAIDGSPARFDAFAALRNHPFPGGRLLRVPLSVLGSWYYRAREGLGL